MQCPHCLTDFHDKRVYLSLGADSAEGGRGWLLSLRECSKCGREIFHLVQTSRESAVWDIGSVIGREVVVAQDERLIHPKVPARAATPESVPESLAEDFNEAIAVLPDSAKASAALSRRCLQHLLREHVGVKEGSLYNQIEELLAANELPGWLASQVDAVRQIGNFAAHPEKSEQSGEIMTVEPGEAEWNLEVLEALFDFYFVKPAQMQARRAALDAKLIEAGKKPPEPEATN